MSNHFVTSCYQYKVTVKALGNKATKGMLPLLPYLDIYPSFIDLSSTSKTSER